MSETMSIPVAELTQLENTLETLEEALADAERMLASEDRGWSSLSGDGTGSPIARDEIKRWAQLARIMAIHDPLIRRGTNLRVSYVWGQGVTVQADDGSKKDQTNGQDVNAVVQAFWDDQEATFTGAQACEERERALNTDGNVFLSLPTDPATGRVQVRTIPDSQIADILTDPEDAETPWLYKRTWEQQSVQRARNSVTQLVSSVTMTQTRTARYPALGYKPASKARTLDGHPIVWDKPVLHVRVNRPSGSKWGIPDLLAALPWAKGYTSFLQDWAKLVKALSAFAFKATAADKRGAANNRERFTSADASGVGATVQLPEGQKLEAIGKSGATIDSRSGMPMAAQVAAALEVPATILTSDPGVTGARATAETLDQPLRLTIGMRRDLNANVIHRVLDHVIDASIRAPRGLLKGQLTIDPVTGKQGSLLAGDQDPGIEIDWPELEDIDLTQMIEALTKADSVGYLPPEIIARLMLIALDVDNADEVLEKLVDKQTGEFKFPERKQEATDALGAVGAGRFPTQE